MTDRREKLSDTERRVLLDLAERGFLPLSLDVKRTIVEFIATHCLIEMGLATFRKKWWLFGEKGVALTVVGMHRAANIVEWGEG